MREIQSLEHFTIFVFLHMGYVDGSLLPIERDTIIEKIKALFPGREDAESELLIVEGEYKGLSEGKAETLIKSGLTVFSNIDPHKKKRIYEGLFDIINANGRVHSEETHTLRLLKTWLLAD